MIDWIYHRLPEAVKVPLDVISASTALSALFGALTGLAAFIGAVASAVYLVARAYYYIKDQRAKR